MPRGGHRGILFAVSGRALTPFGRRRKRGLYHHCTNELFRPSWGPLKVPSLIEDVKLPSWAADTLSPKEKLPPATQYHRDAKLAFPLERLGTIVSAYRRNVYRYFQPASCANDPYIRNYIYQVLDPSYCKSFSGIGMDFNGQHQVESKHISDVVKDMNSLSAPLIDLKYKQDEGMRFRRLYAVVRDAQSWRSVAPTQETSTNPFPHVNESASLVRNLTVADVLHTRSNHRLARRAHPKWYTARYRKFVDKKRLQEKLLQLKLEASA
ncbi:hypothetical protein BBOV_I000850 [Babesia bovis T2Bo]|uniref:Uncharacterized protein n=1 Tax=Babesia bovis TaxID=5865 RepID=A7AXA6_BABBO|nr:hypothetical protein BBOV_I000850 [Babesia bovis T2Bo]EDO05179.1 hypothetical protein BBOV_I000850 [Babesia bovis T2Bo]|eukprot:XP_001608747.1 hypothetical protein [Babesia bovis T2Bo]